MHRLTAVATDILGTGMTAIAPHGKDDVGHKKQITDIPQRGDAEDDVVGSTHGSKSAEIKQGLAEGQTMARHIDTRQSYNEHRPHRDEKDGKHGLNDKGVERGMEIELASGAKFWMLA